MAESDLGGQDGPPDPGLRQLIESYPPLSAAELAQLLALPDGQTALVHHHLGMVLEVAERHGQDPATTEDLFQEGSAALVTLVHGLDPTRPPTPEEFTAQLRSVLDQVMAGLLAERAAARQEDERWAADAERLAALEAQLRLEQDAPPSDATLAERLGWPRLRVVQLRRAVAQAQTDADDQLLEAMGELEEP